MFKRHKWGWGITLISREHFKVKILRFNKFGQTSLQRHSHRQELWCCLKGHGLLSIGKRSSEMITSQMKAGDSWHVKNWHRFCALVPSTILEIQFGAICKEDDIERA